ncbi:RNA 2',3'-cyclic phosphodiesterase [Kiritimatiella glycovorans]|uniref:RNA 2',3'-cyclic phosphodiesterase n=1 Tax=Kiritimatiella glycovorans TaxID=1307763 RepID=A0A0G3EAT6_9BACT|nr:RNA 2',3'-cyclic phosphodiesterase [Kiritimatiella glycovorans]AKJ63373.1 2'-5'-RNA ligase [Kiritimatiella glycovorans]
MHRLFIAAPVPDEVRRRMALVQRALEENLAGRAKVKWTREEGIHLTLAFLGDTEKECIAPLEAALSEALNPLEPFECRLGQPGWFGPKRSPRVLWVGIRDTERLCALQKVVADACRAQGFELEPRPFHPHLTLGRVKGGRDRAAAAHVMKSEITVPGKVIPVHAVELMESTRTPAGARYEVLKRIAL